jgi:hypothetical protein
MNLEPLPPGLRELEQALARRPAPEPPADLRARVLSAMSAPVPAAPRRAAWHWGLAWKAAAAVVLALNLALTAANASRYRRLAEAPPADAPLARYVTAPGAAGATDADDRIPILTASALANWAPAPDAGPLGRSVFSTEEEREWDTP